MPRLKSIHIRGWKSIKDQMLELAPLNVVIGANGSGKSNLLSVFRLLNAMFATVPGFRLHVAKSGGADSVLHFGVKETPIGELDLRFESESLENGYSATLAATEVNTLIFAKERVDGRSSPQGTPLAIDLGAGHAESGLPQRAEQQDPVCKSMLSMLRGCRLFDFRDTSEFAALRRPARMDDNRMLARDGGNFAAMLYLYRAKEPEAFRRIVIAVRQVVPDFHDFVLEPDRLNMSGIPLNWAHKQRGHTLGAHQLSDGSLRFIALATLLLQPNEDFPLLIALDEPELGLHPAAIELLAEMLRVAATQTQVLVATQSRLLVDLCDPEDVIVVESHAGETEWTRLSSEPLTDWLDDYSLGELWQKNVVGGSP
jgi:predicted ATPase